MAAPVHPLPQLETCFDCNRDRYDLLDEVRPLVGVQRVCLLCSRTRRIAILSEVRMYDAALEVVSRAMRELERIAREPDPFSPSTSEQ